MKKTSLLAMLAVTMISLSSLAGCKADPHDTHIMTPIAAPR